MELLRVQENCFFFKYPNLYSALVRLSIEAVTYLDYTLCSNMCNKIDGQRKPVMDSDQGCHSNPLLIVDVLSSRFPAFLWFSTCASLLQVLDHVYDVRGD